MKKSLALLGSLLVATGAVTRCSNGDNTTGDAGPDVTAKDSSKLDVQQQDNNVPIVTPAGTELAASDQIQIFGVSTDNQVIYADNSASAALFAVDAAGGTPTKIASPTVSSSSTYIAGIAGKVVFVWEGISTTANAPQVGSLHLWIKGGTYVPAIAADAGTGKSAASAGFAASADGTKVMFSANSTANAATGDIVGANSDGTSPSTLLTAVDLGSDCSPVLGFAGGTTAVTSSCATGPGDGGVPSAAISSYSGAWVATSIITGALDFWSTDTAGDKLLVATPAAVQVFPIGGGAGTSIDTKNIGINGFGYLTKNGNSALYTTPAGALYLSPVVSPSPVQLQASGVKVVRSYSADDKYTIYSTNFDSQQFGSDLYLASMTAAGTPTTLVATTNGALFGLRFTDDFTTDSKYAIYITNLNASQGIGDLNVLPVGGTTPVTVTTAEWQNLSATASKIVFNDNCQNCSGTSASGGTADLKVVDVSTTNPATMLQVGADVTIYLSNAKDRVIYTYSQNPQGTPPVPTGGNGLYSVAIP